MKGIFVLALAAVGAPAAAQDVYKCVNWQRVVTYQSEPCAQGQRLERVYTPTHVEIEGRAVRNYVPSASNAQGGLSPTYGQPMNPDGSAKSDALCGAAQGATARRGTYRNIELLASDASLRSAHCNHARGPGR